MSDLPAPRTSARAPERPPPPAGAIRRALARARDGKTLDPGEAATLMHARGEQLATLLAHAGRVRDAGLAAAGRPGVITYSRKVFIPLTRLCRDRCGYCTFVTVPGRLDSPYLSPDEVLAIARQGAALGCKEALFTLGDRPEDRWRQARDWLDARGYDDTLSYVRAMAIGVLEETGLLPHLNPGVLTWQDFARLKPVAPSMGMMLETTATRLFTDRGGPHYGSPDKDPAVRLRVLEDAGRSAVPFTTGILIGIGETLAERADSIFAIRRVAQEYGGIQEVIVQNFRAKPDTKMRAMPDAELDDLAATIAVARLVLGPSARIQAPPNLIGDAYQLILAAGIDDWGGVSPLTPDHVNPERPWPQIDELARRTEAAGMALRERLTIYPPYIAEPWLDPRLAGHVAALADPASGLARDGAMPRGRPWQEPDGGWGESSGRTDLHVTIDTTGRTADRRDDFAEVYGDWAAVAARIDPAARAGPPGPAGGSRSASAGAGGEDGGRRARAAARRGGGRAAGGRAGPGRAQRRAGPRAAGRRRTGTGGARRARRLRAPRRGRRRHHLRGHPQHQLHQRLLHRLPVLRLRAAPHRRRRLHALAGADRGPGGGGVAGGRDRGVHAGRDPPRPARDRLLRHRRGGEAPLPGHARARVLADGGRQRRGEDRARRAGVAGAGQAGRRSTRTPAPRPRSSTTTCGGC